MLSRAGPDSVLGINVEKSPQIHTRVTQIGSRESIFAEVISSKTDRPHLHGEAWRQENNTPLALSWLQYITLQLLSHHLLSLWSPKGQNQKLLHLVDRDVTASKKILAGE